MAVVMRLPGTGYRLPATGKSGASLLLSVPGAWSLEPGAASPEQLSLVAKTVTVLLLLLVLFLTLRTGREP